MKIIKDLPSSQAAEQLLLIPGVNKQWRFNAGVKSMDLLETKKSIYSS